MFFNSLPALAIFSLGIVFSFLLAGCSTNNSSESDNLRYAFDPGEVGLSPPQVRFRRASRALSRHCMGCHSAFGGTFSENDYLSYKSAYSGYFFVVAGDLNNSAIYRVLRGAGGAQGIMPPAPYAPLNDFELGLVEDWILHIGQP